jgi:hypothetical protein
VVTLPATIGLEAEVTQVSYPEPAYMWVRNTLSGYRKLKFGYSSQSIYSPLMNVIEGGNTHIQITMKVLSPTINWSKILLKPMGIGSLALQPYIQAAGVATDDWFTITIPLSDFSSTINFTQIANLEFPYSADAPAFELAISCIRFTGGTSPFLWFGEGKTDNKHNGTGNSGELIASVVPTMLPPVYPSKVVFTQGEIVLGEDLYPPFQFSWVNPESGSYQVFSTLYMSDNQTYQSNPIDLEVLPEPPPPCSVALNLLPQEDSLQAPATIQITATVTGLTPPPPDYLLVTNSFTGYRKLKLGYSSSSLYSPLLNVLEEGNTHLEIVLRDVAGGANWGKIQIRPGGIGTMSLLPYVTAAGGVGSDWTTLLIPLSDFSASVPFTALANIEFPYSASAPYFQIAVKSIRFIGGSSPFVWFGYGKTDNKHNGNGGSGELVASLFLGQQSGDHIEKVEFFSSGNKIGEDTDYPYEFGISGMTTGNYSLTARVTSHLGILVTSQPSQLIVYDPPLPSSTMSISLTSPATGSRYLAPLNLPVGISTTGAINPEPDYMKVVNTLTGYVKLKLGYSPTSIYTPKQNVIAGGNDTIEIVLKNLGGTIDWNKIRLRPEGIGSLTLGPYVTAAGGVGNEWKTIRIPLSAFDTSIRFNAIGYMEFPFSAGANNFTMAVQSIRFTGGSSPFTWFGFGKTNNAHDGDGGTGHMTATVLSPNNLAVDISKVILMDNGTVIQVDSVAPFSLMLSNPASGPHSLQVKMIDTRNAATVSNTVVCDVLTSVPDGDLLITVQFDQTPSSLQINKAPLRYDKDFAYSLSLDDGLSDAYSCAYKLLGGGYSTVTQEIYPGLHFTDGCGNSIPFKGSLMWNSVSSTFTDIHINTPSYMTWSQLNEMLDNGWGIVNHSYSHATDPLTTNHAWQITANDSAVFSRTGRHMNHFVVPGGSTVVGYSPLFWNYGIVCNYSRTSSAGYPNGLQIDSPLSYNQFTVYRDFKCDDTHNLQNIMTGITNCANESTNGKHLWYNDFTHHVSPVTYGGSMLFPLFRYYMEQMESLYGQSGSDRIWAASGVEVFEYLKLRDSSRVTGSWWNNQLKILVDRTNIPQNLQNYAMSFTLDADASITSVTTNDPDVNITFRGNTITKLLNADWQPVAFQPSNPVTGNHQPFFADESDSDYILHQVNGTEEVVFHKTESLLGSGVVTIYDLMGKMVWSGDVVALHNSRMQRIHVPALQPGVYLVKYQDEAGQTLTGRYCQPQ